MNPSPHVPAFQSLCRRGRPRVRRALRRGCARATCALLMLLAPTLGAAGPADDARQAVRAHVSGVAAKLAPRLGVGSVPIVVDERATATAGLRDGSLAISTGLLATLRTDAELAMIVGYELARDSGGPAAAARRGGRPEARADESAAADGMRAVVAAGWDGRAAARAWERVSAASPLGSEGGYSDTRANARRQRAAEKAWRATGQRATATTGHAVGGPSYATEILSRLQAWRFAAAAPAPPPLPPSPPPLPPGPASAPGPTSTPAPGPASAPGRDAPAVPASDATFVVYRRSGGFTGWVAEMRLGTDGSRWVSESQAREAAGSRARLMPDEVAALRADVDAAAARPPRPATPESRWLRDGQLRSIEVRTPQGWRSIALSDGLRLSDEDHRLVRRLEELLALSP